MPLNGEPVRDLLHVTDFAKACKAFIESFIHHGLYNLGGGIKNSLSLRSLISKMEEITGLQAVIDENNLLPKPIPLNYISDLTLIQHELDWKPKISLEKGLQTLF